MNDMLIVLLFLGLVFLIFELFKVHECDHTEQIFFDAAGDELPGEQSEACFCKCLKCGREGVIPSGFQSDAHFEHFLSEREQADLITQKKRIS